MSGNNRNWFIVESKKMVVMLTHNQKCSALGAGQLLGL